MIDENDQPVPNYGTEENPCSVPPPAGPAETQTEPVSETPEPETIPSDSDFSNTAGQENDAPPADIDWSAVGPRMWAVLRNLLGGNKTHHDDKIVIDAAHEDVAEAHDILAQHP